MKLVCHADGGNKFLLLLYPLNLAIVLFFGSFFKNMDNYLYIIINPGELAFGNCLLSIAFRNVMRDFLN